jgi:hypothetical protein
MIPGPAFTTKASTSTTGAESNVLPMPNLRWERHGWNDGTVDGEDGGRIDWTNVLSSGQVRTRISLRLDLDAGACWVNLGS